MGYRVRNEGAGYNLEKLWPIDECRRPRILSLVPRTATCSKRGAGAEH